MRILSLGMPQGAYEKIFRHFGSRPQSGAICKLFIGCVLGSHGLGSHLVVLPTGNPPIGLRNRSQPNWDEGPTKLGPQNLVNKTIFT
jgi:hypothetical protein